MSLRPALCHLGLLASLAACGTASRGAAPAARALTESDSGAKLAMAVGEAFTVKLPSTPGTGYTWEVAGGDPGVVAERPPRASEPAGPEQPGSSVMEAISFVARGPGATRLELSYRRPWEQGVAPARTFLLDITVR